MNSRMLKMYHSLPPTLRSMAASLRGYYLRSWRYDSRSARLVEEALEREQWSAKQWQAWQQQQLAYVLDRAARKVPYYRAHWSERRRRGDNSSVELLENWPLLNKETLRADPRAFVADDCDVRKMYREHTSGTSGKPLDLWQSKETLRLWFALFEARIRSWNGLSRKDRWAILGGQLVTPFDQAAPPFWVWNGGLNQLYMSSYHLAPPNAQAYFEALRRHRVVYLLGYSSSMHTLAQSALEQGLAVPQLKLAISNAEPLYKHQREAIASAFGCEVRDTYGMAEFVAAASECRSGQMHLWPEVGIVEQMSGYGTESANHGESGRFICTGLLNADMPLIRYEVGDSGAISSPAITCACGRQMPVLEKLEGRADDMVLTRDGRRVGRLDPVFKSSMPIREAQIIQESLERIRVRLVPSSAYTQSDGLDIARRLRSRVGDVEVILEQVDRIPRSANGKFRAVVSNITSDSK